MAHEHGVSWPTWLGQGIMRTLEGYPANPNTRLLSLQRVTAE
jgi:hypothetical protein